MTTVVMDHDHSQAPEAAYHDASAGPWIDGSNNSLHLSHHGTPVHEFNGFSFAPLPMEPLYSASVATSRPTHQQLQPLITPQWPSMLTSHSTYQTPLYPATSMPVVAPAPTPVSAAASAPAPSRPASTPRKTLTDADRRRMCLYHEEHPNTKQTEIGAMFGVERSTVSKVLRNKEKYLYSEDGSRSPIKRSKGKFPDIERALSNWARNHQRQGLPLSDSMIREKARFFANSVGTSESHLKANSTSWLEKFKQKNNLMGAKSSRKNSMSTVAESEELISPSEDSREPNISPTDHEPALSASSDSKITSQESFNSFNGGHRPFHSQSNPALSSLFTEPPFSAAPSSPSISPFFTPDGHSPYLSAHNAFSRPRSQTFPALGMDSYISPPSSEPLTPKFLAGPVLDSPMTEAASNPLGIEGAPPVPSHSSTLLPPIPSIAAQAQSSSASASSVLQQQTAASNTSLATLTPTSGVSASSASQSLPPLTTQHSPISPATTLSSPSSPSQEDARRALELVITFFQQQPNGFVEPDDYLTIGKLMEKLRVCSSPQQQQGVGVVQQQQMSMMMGRGEMPGGMHRIASQEFVRKVE